MFCLLIYVVNVTACKYGKGTVAVILSIFTYLLLLKYIKNNNVFLICC